MSEVSCNDDTVEEDGVEQGSSSAAQQKEQPPLPGGFIPQAKSKTFAGHSKWVSAMAVNPAGSRLATGGYDCEVHLWDFNGMARTPAPFRRLTPIAGHGVRALSYSPTGSHFVCAGGDAIARIYNGDGGFVQATVKGDMYVRDQSKTKGHTYNLTDCRFHPFDRERFLCSSMDATVRVFDLTAKPWGIDQALPHVALFKALDKRNVNIAGSCHVTAATWAPTSGRWVLGGCLDGSLQLWDQKRFNNKPDKIIRRNGHTGEVTDVSMFRDEMRLLSRAQDDTMKLWDLRQTASPIHAWTALEAGIAGQSVCLSPDESMVATGTTAANSCASLEIFDVATDFSSLKSIPIAPGGECAPDAAAPAATTSATTATTITTSKMFGVAKVLWPESLQQIILGRTDGRIMMLYDDVYSTKGALLFAERPVTRQERDEALLTFKAPIFTTDALPPGLRETRDGRIRRVKIREKDRPPERQQKTKVPPLPTGREGDDGRKGTGGTLSSYIMGRINISRTRDEDPTEALRAYAKVAEEDPIFVSTAYKRTQPTPVLDWSPAVTEEEELVRSVAKCPRCGLKLCQCGYMDAAAETKKHRPI